MNAKKIVLSLSLIFLMFVVVVFPMATVAQDPPSQGDWVISEYVHLNDATIILNGSILVESGGHLSLDNVTINMASPSPGEYSIIVRNGGAFIATNGTSFAALNGFETYSFKIHGTADIADTKISDLFGTKSSSPHVGGVQIYSDNVTLSNCTISSSDTQGVYIKESSPTLSNSTILNNGAAGVRIDSGSPRLIDNTITLNGEEGIVCYLCSDSLIRDNIISFNTKDGIRSVYGSMSINHNRIAGNGRWGAYLLNDLSSIANNSYTDIANALGRVWKGWEISAGVTDGNNHPLLNASILVKDGLNNTHIDQNTDITGFVPYAAVPEFIESNGGSIVEYNPYRIRVEYNGLVNEVQENITTARQLIPTIFLPDVAVSTDGIEEVGEPGQETAFFVITVQNNEPVPIVSVSVQIAIDGSMVYEESISIAGNASWSMTYNWSGEPGAHIIRVTADSVDALMETNETNNARELSFEMPAVPEDNPTSMDLAWIFLGLAIAIIMLIAIIKIRR